MQKDTYHTLIIGSGCAGYNAADWLFDLGVTDIAVVTEGVNMGTSRNTGSDKQTYYKLTLAGEEPDSVYEMAKTLFDGGSVHGDTALIEAAGSVKSFMKLVQLGLPFPTNRYGAYVGYKTDHDPRQRATSCGPLTSKLMTEALERAVKAKGIPILDNSQVVELLVEDNQVYGLVFLDGDAGLQTLYCENIVLATGGPAGIYSDTVYPVSQTGATGLALAAGAAACNLQEWQYGLASTDFRWNVSGTYQQVLPRYISVDGRGNEYEFLLGYYDNPARALDMVFLKGYQWPFDTRKLDGSSRVDLLVADEKEKGRVVYLDFTKNPAGLDFDMLSEEAYAYLKKSDALFGTPVERLAKMNPKAIDLYRDNGIDLYAQPLKIAVCAQHCNGGIAVDANWESSVRGLYVVGEAAGNFGVYRPGGSALNAAQVGAMRAAEAIAGKRNRSAPRRHQPRRHSGLDPESPVDGLRPLQPASNQPKGIPGQARNDGENMSRFAGYRRSILKMKRLYNELTQYHDNNQLPYPYKNNLITQIAVLSAMILSAETWGTHGGAMVENSPPTATYNPNYVITTTNNKSHFEPVRPIPPCDDWFERIWNEGE